MLASSEVLHHGHRVPTDQLMYIDKSFYCWLSVDLWKDGRREIREDSLNAARFPRHVVLHFCWT